MGYLREADLILYGIAVGYSQWDPKWIYRNYNINGDVFLVNNFGGNLTGKVIEWNASMSLKNYWSVWTGGNLSGTSLSTGMLRGGPMMKLPGNTNARIGFSTDYRKNLTFDVYINGSQGWENDSRNLNTGIDISYKPIDYVSFTISPAYNKSFSELQYVTNLTYNSSDRYIFASIDRKTISASLRINLNLSPDLTFQYWGQPFVSTGRYYDHKYILDPMASRYSNRFHTYTASQLTAGNDYLIDENADGINDYIFGKTDFNYKAFLSNLVVRWEYSPGSSVYLVWSQTRSGYNSTGIMDYFNDMGDLFNRKLFKEDDNYDLKNVFLVKFSYRFGLK
jgi:hypothetical protein